MNFSISLKSIAVFGFLVLSGCHGTTSSVAQKEIPAKASITGFAPQCGYDSQSDCEASKFRCLWSQSPGPEGRHCFAKDYCESSRPEEICNKENGCVYNNDPSNSYCLSPKLSKCKSATESQACGDLWGCIWSEEGKSNNSKEMQHCFGTIAVPALGYSCSDYPKDICASTGCIFDEISNACLSRRVSSCKEFRDEENCGKVGCLWEPDAQKCLSVSPLSSRCDHFSNYGKTTCENAGCLFDEQANPQVCASKYAACANYDPNIDSCPVSFGCRISDDKERCESTNCNLNVMKANCETQPGCTWDVYCRNPN